MRSVVAGVLLPVLVVVLIGPYTFLPSLLEYAVARYVKARLGIEKQPYVELKSDPPLRMLAGEFSGGRIVMKNTDLGNHEKGPGGGQGSPIGRCKGRCARVGSLALGEGGI